MKIILPGHPFLENVFLSSNMIFDPFSGEDRGSRKLQS
jgi:hypothetical protein